MPVPPQVGMMGSFCFRMLSLTLFHNLEGSSR